MKLENLDVSYDRENGCIKISFNPKQTDKVMVERVAQKMAEDSHIDIAAEEENGFVICWRKSVWSVDDIKTLYQDAKTECKQQASIA